MYFKAKFIDCVELEHHLFDEIEISSITGKETLRFNQYEFEIERNNVGNIDGVTFCNQCVNTYGIESQFIKLLLKVLPIDCTVKLFDSNGLTSDLTREDLLEYLL